MASRGRSVRTEIVVGFATVILAFGAVATYSLVWQQRAVASIRLANEGYLGLVVELGEERVNQGLFNTLLDRLLDERERVTSRAWLSLARRSRRGRVQASLARVRAAARQAVDPEDRALLARAARDLAEIDATYAEDEPRLDELSQALGEAERPRAVQLRDAILARESRCEDLLRRAAREVPARIRRLTDEAERRQRQSLQLTLSAIAVACVLGAVSAITASRALKPLTRLRDRARAVARGDLSPVDVRARPDEIGELAGEFERMVAAVAARDAALRAAHDRVLQAERLAAIGRMAAHVTHEVRNPLSSMALNAEMLVDELESSAGTTGDAPRLVRAIQKEIDRLTGITEEYLRVARLPKPSLEREDLRAVASDAAAFVEREMSAAGVRIEVTLADDVPDVMLDESQVRQCLLNLLRNAREAMELAGVASPVIRVQVRGDAARGGAVVALCDAGPGLPEEARTHLFELFFTTKARGTGLGLPLTREIITAHGGTIEADRVPPALGGGARFTIWFPAASDDVTEREA